MVIELDRTQNAINYIPEQAVFRGNGKQKIWYVHPILADGEVEELRFGCEFKTKSQALEFAINHKKAVLANPIILKII